MTPARWYTALIFTVLAAGACLTAPTARGSRTGDPSKITAAEMEAAVGGATLHDFIRRERPQWLTKRGSTTLIQDQTDVVVYRDGVRMGGPAVLRDIPVGIVESAEYLSGPDAATRFGLNHQHGAILVITRR